MIQLNPLTGFASKSDNGGLNRTDEFVRLFSQHEPLVRGFLLTLLPSTGETDDLFQRTSIVLWQKFDEFEPGSNFGAWACQIAKLEVRNHLRVRNRDRHLFSDALLVSLAEVRQALSDELELRREALRHCITKLRPSDQEIIQQCYGPQTTTVKDVAESLGRPVNTLYKALIRIRQALFECVERALKAGGQ
jgi:RNA polymerase sigma-70 factor (ECF subfamily)